MNTARHRGTTALLALLVFAWAIALYLPALDHDFVDVDDGVYVTENPHVQQGLTRAGVVWAFTEFHGSTWVPLTYVSLMLDRTLYGPGPRGFHFTNVVLHALDGVLIFLLLASLTGRRWLACTVAVLFVAHPLRVESVAWVSERKDVLSTFFWLVSTLAWLQWVRHRRPIAYAASGFALALGLCAKGMLVTLPLTLFLFDLWPRRREEPCRRLVMEKIPLFVLAGAGALVAYLSQATGSSLTRFDELGIAERLGNAIVAAALYLQRTFWPSGLAYLYPHPSFVPPYEGWPLVRIVLSSALLLAVTLLVVVLARRGHRAPAVGWSWFLVTLLPVIGLVQIGAHANADRFTYVPHIGLFVGLVFGAAELVELGRTRPRVPRAVGVAVALALVLVASVRTRAELPHWRDSESLFRRAIAVTQDNGVAMDALGAHLSRRGRWDEALPWLERAVEAQPLHAGAHANLGIVLAALGRDDARAAEHLDLALAVQPDHARAHVARANLFARQGRLADAVQHYTSALARDPGLWEAHFGLGLVARTRGDRETTTRHFRRALELAPDETARARIRAAMG